MKSLISVLLLYVFALPCFASEKRVDDTIYKYVCPRVLENSDKECHYVDLALANHITSQTRAQSNPCDKNSAKGRQVKALFAKACAESVELVVHNADYYKWEICDEKKDGIIGGLMGQQPCRSEFRILITPGSSSSGGSSTPQS